MEQSLMTNQIKDRIENKRNIICQENKGKARVKIEKKKKKKKKKKSKTAFIVHPLVTKTINFKE
ncbi:hypothetical protein BLOT_010365 [Blomia tropicalis]|nr:hypothetical protein BLOT_010365 [Blomia tropicalis]